MSLTEILKNSLNIIEDNLNTSFSMLLNPYFLTSIINTTTILLT